jgi:citrate lyase subunit beta/citryl-CoA lyase
MLTPPLRLRRSVLTTPASSERMLLKAAASDADYVILDLEDSVAPSEKATARSQACEAVNTLDWGRKTVGVRVNSVGSRWVLDDLLEISRTAGSGLDVVVVPKVMEGADIEFVSAVLDHVELEAPHGLGIEVLVEEASALAHLDVIVRASRRLETVTFGPGDYAASLRATVPSADADPSARAYAVFARQSIVVAARAVGAVPIDGPFADFNDPDGFDQEARAARASGFAGKWVIHPAQIDAANRAFTPTAVEAHHARTILDAYRRAEEQGTGAVAVGGAMVDAAHARIAEEVVAQCELIGI